MTPAGSQGVVGWPSAYTGSVCFLPQQEEDELGDTDIYAYKCIVGQPGAAVSLAGAYLMFLPV